MTRKIPVPEGERLKQVTSFCMMGATNKELAEFLGVSPQLVKKWISKEPEFRMAVQAGKELADARVAHALYDRATGSEIWEEKAVNLGEAGVEVVKIRRQLAPDTAAAFIWLKNRQGWRDRQESVNVNLEAKADLTEILGEYARRHGIEAAKAIAQHHGYSGLVIEGESELVESSGSE